MIGSSSIETHHAFHLKREEQGADLRNGQRCAQGNDVGLQVVRFSEMVNDALLLGRQRREELPLYALLLSL